jgi:hypothetical protein
MFHDGLWKRCGNIIGLRAVETWGSLMNSTILPPAVFMSFFALESVPSFVHLFEGKSRQKSIAQRGDISKLERFVELHGNISLHDLLL